VGEFADAVLLVVSGTVIAKPGPRNGGLFYKPNVSVGSIPQRPGVFTKGITNKYGDIAIEASLSQRMAPFEGGNSCPRTPTSSCRHTIARAWTAWRGGFDRVICVAKSLSRPQGAVHPIARPPRSPCSSFAPTWTGFPSGRRPGWPTQAW
jgi:hypothetical protein